MAERYVLLGLALARAEWFRTIGKWSTSAMLAVLIMAIIGGLMWVAFSGVFATAEQRVTQEVERIGD
jgi:hypothetical protein